MIRIEVPVKMLFGKRGLDIVKGIENARKIREMGVLKFVKRVDYIVERWTA